MNDLKLTKEFKEATAAKAWSLETKVLEGWWCIAMATLPQATALARLAEVGM